MPKKKAPVQKNAVLPNPLSDVRTNTCFEGLVEGEYFIMGGRLHHKLEDDYGLDQSAADVLTGEISNGLCDENVIPVVVTITWERK